MGEDRPGAQPGRNTPGVLNPGPEWVLREQSWTVSRKCGQKTAQPREVQGGLGGWWPFQSRLWDETLWPSLTPSTTLTDICLAGRRSGPSTPQASQPWPVSSGDASPLTQSRPWGWNSGAEEEAAPSAALKESTLGVELSRTEHSPGGSWGMGVTQGTRSGAQTQIFLPLSLPRLPVA